MSKVSRKKPTMKETVQVINQIIREISSLKTDMRTVTGVLDMYVEMKGDTDKFKDFIDKQINVEENNDVQRNEEGSTLAVEGSPEN